MSTWDTWPAAIFGAVIGSTWVLCLATFIIQVRRKR